MYMKQLINCDEELYWHSHRTAQIAEYLARTEHYSEETIEEIIKGALLHDFGKIMFPVELLHKKNITANDFREIKKHTQYGYELLKDLNFSDIVMDIVMFHHENETGSGYPNGSTQMNEITKLVAFADKYEAMTGRRTYKKAYDKETAISILSSECRSFVGCEKYCARLLFYED